MQEETTMNLTVFYTSGRAGRSCTQGIAGLLIERLRGDGEVFAFHLPRDKFVLLYPDPKYSWWITGPSVMKNVDITKALLEAACAPAAGEGQKNSQN